MDLEEFAELIDEEQRKSGIQPDSVRLVDLARIKRKRRRER